MGYLLDPVARELLDRVQELDGDGEFWCWVGTEYLSQDMPGIRLVNASFFDQGSLPQEQDETAGFDGIVIHLETAWLEFSTLLDWCFRYLKPGGHLLFSTFGPDTLFQLREAWEQTDEMHHLHDFVDLQGLGDQMMRAGFERPILDSDWLGVEYEDLPLLFDDLRRQGFQNLRKDRRKTLTGAARFKQIRDHFSAAGPIQMTYEIIYGYAKKRPPASGSIAVQAPVRD